MEFPHDGRGTEYPDVRALIQQKLKEGAAGRIDDVEPNFDALLVYRETIFRICLGFSRNYAEAEDLAQDVYVRALRSLPVLKNPSQMRDWLFRIAKNVCLDQKEKNWNRAVLLRRWAKETTLEEDILAKNETKEKLAALKSAVRSLSKKLRSVFILREYGHLTYEEIAITLGIRPGTVMSRLNRARRRVEAKFKERSHGQARG
jgi:RNA polymerase sigma-70 factor (ECF subfamily)